MNSDEDRDEYLQECARPGNLLRTMAFLVLLSWGVLSFAVYIMGRI